MFRIDIEKAKKLEYLIEKVIDIEKLIYEKYEGKVPYTFWVLEILHNIKNNEEFEIKNCWRDNKAWRIGWYGYNWYVW